MSGGSSRESCMEAALQATTVGCMVTDARRPEREILNEAAYIFDGPQQHSFGMSAGT